MIIELLVLRVVHVLGGIFWVGSALFTTLFLAPAVMASGPAAGQIFASLQKRGLMTVLFWGALLTIASGLRLLWIVSGGFSTAYLETPAGRTFTVAGGAAIVAFLIAALVSRPAGMRMGRIGAMMATAPAEQRDTLAAEMESLRRRNAMASAAVAMLLVLSAAGMAVARYVG